MAPDHNVRTRDLFPFALGELFKRRHEYRVQPSYRVYVRAAPVQAELPRLCKHLGLVHLELILHEYVESEGVVPVHAFMNAREAVLKELLVGIEPENPIAFGLGQREIACSGEILIPGVVACLGSEIAGNLKGPIG